MSTNRKFIVSSTHWNCLFHSYCFDGDINGNKRQKKGQEKKEKGKKRNEKIEKDKSQVNKTFPKENQMKRM